MVEALEKKSFDNVEDALAEISELLEKHASANAAIENQSLEDALLSTETDQQYLTQLQHTLHDLHPADVAFILEALPLDQRLLVWDLVKAERDGEILLEVSDAVRETLIAHMDNEELLAAAEQLDTDEIADLAPDLPHDVMQDLLESLDAQNRARLHTALSYQEDSVGGLMDFEMVTIRDDITLEVVLRYLRRFDALPDLTDKLFVVDQDDHLRGVLSLKQLLLNNPDAEVSEIMDKDIVSFHPEDGAEEASQAFERYDLVTAPVADADNKLVGRLTVNTVMDFIREESESDMLTLAGLREDEDVFASVWKSAKNRWLWLAINLITAFIASRVIGVFEGTIEKLVALAALMPIVAGIGGNSGNQTTALIIRALALRQITSANARRLVTKELGISLLNGIVWGSIVGIFAALLYQNIALGLVMAAAMLLNLLVAALVGIFIPLTIHKLGKDPALGSSVLLTATTDSMGFFIFLGLATVFLT